MDRCLALSLLVFNVFPLVRFMALIGISKKKFVELAHIGIDPC